MKIIALSDLHLVPQGQTSKGLDTADRLRLALADVGAKHADAAFCVMLGDLADRGEVGAYQLLKELINELPVPVHLMIGNHDDRETFLHVFSDHRVDANGYVQGVHDTAEGRFVFLDTAAAGRDDGVLCERRLAWLEARLGECAGQPAYVFLHHPPYEIGLPVDNVRLVDSQPLLDILQQYGNVRHLFSGHTHRSASGVWRGLPFASLGATHYNVGLHLKAWEGPVPRFYAPAYYSVILIDEAQVLVHQNDYLTMSPRLAPQLFSS